MKRPPFLKLFLALTISLILGLVLVGCGGGDEMTTTMAPTTVSPATTALASTTSTTSAESTTTTERTIDEELVGVWATEQGIELEFTSDGVAFLRYQEQEVDSPYSTADGKVFYISFEANKQGERVPTETPYIVHGDTLTWEAGGGSELTFTKKQ